MLILPAWHFANQVDNLTGTPPAALVGTNFTAGASSADGSSVSVLSALAFDVHYLVVGIGGVNTSGTDTNALLDVLTDPAGGTSWGSFIDDLICGFTPTPAAGTTSIDFWYHFPIFIKSGSSVGVRARNASVSSVSSGRVVMYAMGNPSRPDLWWCGQKVESLGINAASSKGTNVTPGNSGSFGSWTTIGTSTADYGAVQFGVNGSDNSAASLGYFWEFGYSSTKLPGSPTLYLSSNSSTESCARVGHGMPIFCNIPNGTTMQARAVCSGVAEVYNAAVYGVY